MIKQEKKLVKRILFRIGFIILVSALVYLELFFGWRFEPFFELPTIYGILISVGISLILSAIIILLKKLGVIKTKTEEEKIKEKELKEEEKERIKLEREEIDKLEYKDLVRQSEKTKEKLEYLEKKIKVKDESNQWVWYFVEFGMVVFFVALLFFGSLNGTYLDREVYVSSLSNISEVGTNALTYSFGLLFEVFESLVIKLYDIGSESQRVFFWLWIATIFCWIGYMFLYKIIFNGCKFTIKELILPPLKKVKENLKGGKKRC